MNFKKNYTTTMSNASSTPPLTRASLNKAISMLGADFAKAKATTAVWGKLNFQWIQMSLFTLPTPSPNLRCLPATTMTKKEIEIQKALGTLPYKEWMKIKGILFENKIESKISWWYFPIPKTMECKSSETIPIDGIEHFPVADGYIDDLQHSMNWNKWSEEEFAIEIITQCYSSMSLMEIDH